MIQWADDSNNVMTAACHYAVNGLVPGHAYTVRGANSNNGRIQVRNPWSTESYHGDGSDQDDDGNFEIPVSTFVEAFPNFSILYYKDWHTTRLGAQVGSKGY